MEGGNSLTGNKPIVTKRGAGQGGGEGPTGSGCRRGGQLRSGADLSLVTVGFSWTLAKGFLGRGEKSHFSGFQERRCVLPCGCGQHQPPPLPPVSLPAQSWGWWRPRLQGQLSLSAPPSAPKPVPLQTAGPPRASRLGRALCSFHMRPSPLSAARGSPP